MKKQLLATTVVAALLSLTPHAFAGRGSAPAWNPVVGARYYTDHSIFDELPFSSGDIGYVGGLECREGDSVLQILVTYAPSLDGEKWADLAMPEVADYVITPELTLLASDGAWQAGGGILASYIATDLDEDWTDVYYKFQLGYTLGRGRMKIGINADYTFEDVDALSEFDFDDLDYSLLLHIAL